MISEELAAFAARVRHADIPAATRRAARDVFVDTVGCAFGGARTALGRETIALAAPGGGARGGECTVIAAAARTTAAEAAFANAILCNLIDYNDVTLVPVGHVSSEVIPAALAAAELTGASGPEVLAAIVAGYEVALRVGLAVDYSPRSEIRGPISLPTYHVFGATAAAGRLLGLDAPKLAHALGIAATHAMMPASNYVGTKTSYMLKSITHGVSARNAVTSALLARAGLDAPLDFFETTTSDAFWRRARSDRFDAARLTAGLGAEWLLDRVHLKAFPSCGWTHGATTAVEMAMGSETIAPRDVEEIRVETFRGGAEKDNRRPRTMADAIFSTPYAIAMTLLRVPRGPRWYAEELIASAEARALMDKVVLIEDPEATRAIPDRQPTRAVLRLRGRVLSATSEHMLGSPKLPMSDEMRARKFVTMASDVVHPDAAARLELALRDVEAAGSLRGVCDALRA